MASVGCLSFPSIGNSDSIFKLDAATGAIDWAYRTEAPEQFQSFPVNQGPTYHDYGFLNGPILAEVSDGMSGTVPVAVAICVAALWQQAAALVKDRGGPANPPVGAGEMVDLYVNDVLARRVTLFDLETGQVAVQVLLALALVAVAVGADLRRDGRAGVGAVLRRLGVAGAFVAASPLFMFVSVYVNHAYAERYAAIPAGLVITGVVVAVAGRGVVHRVLVAVVAVAMVGSVVYTGQVSYLNRSIGPGHTEQVDRAREVCRDGRALVRVPTAPSTAVAPDNEGVWFVLLRCSDVVTSTDLADRAR